MKKKEITLFQKKVYEVCRKIPRGQVSTYGEIARAIGAPRAARAVGNALNRNPFAPRVPCHRVVKSDGSVGGFASGNKDKVKILRKEGLAIKKGKVVDFKYFIRYHNFLAQGFTKILQVGIFSKFQSGRVPKIHCLI